MSLFLIAALFASSAHAFRFGPMVLDLASSGKGATQMVVLDNPEKERVAVQLELVKRVVNADGKEDRTQPAEGFVLYPEQVTLEPGQRRSVRVTWTGEAALERELSFRLVASQIIPKASAHPDPKAKVPEPVQFVASLYVVPKDAKPEITVISAKLAKPGSAEIILENTGGRHRMLENLKLKIHGAKGGDYEVPAEALKDLHAQNLLAGSARRFTFSVPKELSGELTAEARFP